MDGASIERMPAWVVGALVNARGLTRVDDDEPFVVFDNPGVDRQPLGPVVVEEHVAKARGAARPARLRLCAPDLDQAGADGVDSGKGGSPLMGPGENKRQPPKPKKFTDASSLSVTHRARRRALPPAA